MPASPSAVTGSRRFPPCQVGGILICWEPRRSRRSPAPAVVRESIENEESNGGEEARSRRWQAKAGLANIPRVPVPTPSDGKQLGWVALSNGKATWCGIRLA